MTGQKGSINIRNDVFQNTAFQSQVKLKAIANYFENTADGDDASAAVADNNNNNNTIQFNSCLLTCNLNSPEANYKVSRST
jgi:hypothetical protein